MTRPDTAAPVLLDASALLALLQQEPGAERVAAAVAAGAVIGAVNLSEVVAKLDEWGVPHPEIHDALEALGLRVAPFDTGLAYAAGMLRRSGSARGLSLGDRACLALGVRDELPILTGDRAWEGVVPGAVLEWIR